MKSIYRRIAIFVVAIVVIGAGYFGYRFYAASQRSVPQEFSDARSQGALISEKIISNSNDISASIAQLNSTTSTPAQVSSTIGQILGKAAEVRSQASELAATLEKMTKVIPDIRSQEAQRAAIESISNRVTLANHLITYTDEVDQLAKAMRERLATGAKNGKDINLLVKEINAEVTAVNKLSKQADEAMAKFDSIVR